MTTELLAPAGGQEALVAAVLTAVNITDELFKEREAGDALRRQLKQYLDEASQAKNEVSELKREIFKLQQQKK